MKLSELSKASTDFSFDYVTKRNINDVLALEKGNTLYYKLLQKGEPGLSECCEDLTAVPKGKELSDKLFTAVYKNNELVAVIDFVDAYPDAKTGFLGFFMVNAKLHHKGVAKELFSVLKTAAVAHGFTAMQLGCYSTNTPGLAFWQKCGFCETDRVEDSDNKTIIKMSLKL